ncbi:AP1S2 [Cordylochernes scorpioides]|uniref:AP1S2 n=1 Tax=Cordylochernes scorpioides TaxID=51811 RepID=A0ABY6KUW7_9ARAC|nr:AP1S2 [Cordylochernes scorpioides]
MLPSRCGAQVRQPVLLLRSGAVRQRTADLGDHPPLRGAAGQVLWECEYKGWTYLSDGQVCELDIIFNFEKAYFILDELLIGGEIQETSKKNVLKAIAAQDLLQEVRFVRLLGGSCWTAEKCLLSYL